MVEERSFENPKFARSALQLFAIMISVPLTSYLVTDGWELWSRILVNAAAALVAYNAVTVLFWKFAGVPMREPRKAG